MHRPHPLGSHGVDEHIRSRVSAFVCPCAEGAAAGARAEKKNRPRDREAQTADQAFQACAVWQLSLNKGQSDKLTPFHLFPAARLQRRHLRVRHVERHPRSGDEVRCAVRSPAATLILTTCWSFLRVGSVVAVHVAGGGRGAWPPLPTAVGLHFTSLHFHFTSLHFTRIDYTVPEVQVPAMKCIRHSRRSVSLAYGMHPHCCNQVIRHCSRSVVLTFEAAPLEGRTQYITQKSVRGAALAGLKYERA